LPIQIFRGRDLNPDSTVQSRMSCLLDDPGDISALTTSHPLPWQLVGNPMTSTAFPLLHLM
jgi:hypothetical protein